MYQKILNKLHINKGEAALTMLLFCNAVCLGIFIAVFDILAHTTYFQYWETIDISLVFLFSGVLGIFIFLFYTFLFKRINFKLFHVIFSLLVLVLVLGYTIIFNMYHAERAAFYSVVLLFPVNFLAFSTFWRFNRIVLYPAQTRRIFPVLDTGIIIGVVLGVLAISFISQRLETEIQYYLLTALLIVKGILLLPVLFVHNNNKVFNSKTERRIPVRFSFSALWSVKSSRYLMYFAFLSAVIGYYLHFGFINITRIKYADYAEFSGFYGWFIAVMFLTVILTDRYLIRKILYTYNSPYSLVLLPIGIALLLFGLLLESLFLQWMHVSETLLYIFLVGIIKIVYETSRSSLQLPSFRTIYRTLDKRILQITMPRAEGLVVMLGLLFSGGIIFALQLLGFEMKTFVGMGISLCVVWFIVSVKLIRSYKESLQNSYKKLRVGRYKSASKQTYREKLRKILVMDDPARVIPVMRLTSKLEPLNYARSLQRMLANPESKIHRYVLECIRQESLIHLLDELKTIQNKEGRKDKMLQQIIQEFEQKQELIGNCNIQELIASKEKDDRILAAEIIGLSRNASYTSSLVYLTREIEMDVRKAAVRSIAQIGSSQYSYLLIELLSVKDFQAYAFEALVQIGDPALDYLERLFINPGTNDKILSWAIRIYGRVASKKAIGLLLSKLDNQSKRIVHVCIEALHEANFQADKTNINKILNVIVRTVHNIGWNSIIVISLPNKTIYNELRQAYIDDTDHNYDMLFDLLSLAYNASAINEIRALLGGSAADISHAIEMLDHIVLEEIKPVLFPVLENISIHERARKLQYYFPIESMSTSEIIAATLTRDYNLLSMYPRICAMTLSLQIRSFEVQQELISNLFHPNPLLYEVAAMVISKKQPKLFESLLERLDEGVRFKIQESLHTDNSGGKYLLVDIFSYLKSINTFSGISEEIIIDLAQAFNEIHFKGNSVLDLQNNLIQFSIFIVIEGGVGISGNNKVLIDVRTNELYYSEVLIKSGVKNLTFTSESTILAMDSSSLESLLFDFPEVLNCILKSVESFKLAG